MEAMIKESPTLEKINIDTKKIVAEKTGINETQLEKIEQLSEDGVIVGGSADVDFSIPIKNGVGSASYSKTTWWVTITITGKIISPSDGTWHITIKDGDTLVFDQGGIGAGTEITISNYKTGFSVDLNIIARWSIPADTTLTGHLHIEY